MSLINELNCQDILGSSLFISGCFQNGKNHDYFHFGNSRSKACEKSPKFIQNRLMHIVHINCTVSDFFVFLSEK